RSPPLDAPPGRQARHTTDAHPRPAPQDHPTETIKPYKQPDQLPLILPVLLVALILSVPLAAWISTKIADAGKGGNSAQGDPPSNDTFIPEPTIESTHNSDEAPAQGSCIPNTICRYLRISPGQEFNLDNWGASEGSTIVLLGAGGLAATHRDVKMTLVPYPPNSPANPLPCPDADGWVDTIPQIGFNQSACVRTPGGKYFLLTHLVPTQGQTFERFLAAGFPE
ncbi:MAG: hypothetical protein ABIQ18_46765, partial [Umezawaea sp.]